MRTGSEMDFRRQPGQLSPASRSAPNFFVGDSGPAQKAEGSAHAFFYPNYFLISRGFQWAVGAISEVRLAYKNLGAISHSPENWAPLGVKWVLMHLPCLPDGPPSVSFLSHSASMYSHTCSRFPPWSIAPAGVSAARRDVRPSAALRGPPSAGVPAVHRTVQYNILCVTAPIRTPIFTHFCRTVNVWGQL
jgi:hypothetical protein